MIHFHRIQIGSKTVFKKYELFFNNASSRCLESYFFLTAFNLGENKFVVTRSNLSLKAYFGWGHRQSHHDRTRV